MKGFIKALVWILILVAVAVGVYFILPEYPQSSVKSIFQPMTDAVAKSKIEQVQNMLNKDFDNASYKTILESKAKNPCWVYRKDETTGMEYVTFYGRGVQINLQDYAEYNGMLSTSASVKIEFEINGNKVDIHPYVDDFENPMEIKDGKHTEENKKIRKAIFSQLYTGMTEE